MFSGETHLLSICALLFSDSLVQQLTQNLQSQSSSGSTPTYQLTCFTEPLEFIEFIAREKRQVDCLLIEEDASLPNLLRALRDRSIFLPLVILSTAPHPQSISLAVHPGDLLNSTAPPVYHTATLQVSSEDLQQLPQIVDEAISKFLRLSSAAPAANSTAPDDLMSRLSNHSSLMLQQRRLAEKLKERLGYLGVYYKRNPANFLRHMSQSSRQEFLQQLKEDYRDIILNYFTNDPTLNEKLDNFVNLAFFADVSVAQIVEIHMELIDEFSKQLKLEGRNDEILLDYRLTLIDAIAHLCEMYRRSIPRES
ncbi:MAG TPA: circadian clock protein KaiA [Synechococcales cyanobacterium M55_K2018_004]|nr:circadian clock protein KaiA [Synechococcales cyanobacterium M55_K2018_004]